MGTLSNTKYTKLHIQDISAKLTLSFVIKATRLLGFMQSSFSRKSSNVCSNCEKIMK